MWRDAAVGWAEKRLFGVDVRDGKCLLAVYAPTVEAAARTAAVHATFAKRIRRR